MTESEDGHTSGTSSGNAPERKEVTETSFGSGKRQASSVAGTARGEGGATSLRAQPGAQGPNADADATIFTPKPTGKPGKIGLVVNNIWEVRRLIAQGGMGEVYEAFEKVTTDKVAIKFLLP